MENYKTKNVFRREGDILRYIMTKPVDKDEAIALDVGGTEIINKGETPFVLIDIRKSTDFSSAARKIWVEFLKNPNIKKAAIFGGNILVRTTASFIIVSTGKKNIKFFDKEAEALEWIKK